LGHFCDLAGQISVPPLTAWHLAMHKDVQNTRIVQFPVDLCMAICHI
jgi:hypothetical protein